MPEGSFKNSMNPTSVRTKIIELQKPSDSENVKPQPMGSRVTIHTPKGKQVEVQYQLVSAADLVAPPPTPAPPQITGMKLEKVDNRPPEMPPLALAGSGLLLLATFGGALTTVRRQRRAA